MRLLSASDIEAEQNHIPVPHYIILALQAEQALLAGGGHGAAGLQIREGDHLRPDEAPLKIRVDFSRSLGRFGALGDGPGPALVRAGGQEGDQPKEGIAFLNNPVQAGCSSSRNSARSSWGMPAISASILAQMGNTPACSSSAMASTSW